jgi:hypothetical protein
VRTSRQILLVLAAIVLLAAPSARAQTDANRPDPEKIKLQLGPLIINPTITLGNFGSDENVFNDATNPKRDLTMTLSPKTELWLPFLGSWFQGTVAEDLTWYKEYSSERSANHTVSLDWKLPLTRFTADVGVARSASSARPGFEIDARVHHVQTEYGAAASIWFLATTAIDVSVKRGETDFDQNTQYGGADLSQELNGNTMTYTVGVSQKLTSLTTASVGFSQRLDRFTYNPLRDADSREVKASVRFDPGAYFKGGVSLGLDAFRPKSADLLPSYTGATFGADVSFAPTEVTRLTVKGERAIKYSYDDAQPYYLQTGYSAEVTQQVVGPFDVVGRGGTASLDYRTRAGVVVPFADRADRVTTYGLGIGYHLGKNIRVSFNADQIHRDSPIDSRRYNRLTYGSALTYDF